METLRLRVEKRGRAGKTVTVVEGFTREKRLMEQLASAVKRALATGGSFEDRTICLQGDVRDRLRVLLAARGFKVKG